MSDEFLSKITIAIEDLKTECSEWRYRAENAEAIIVRIKQDLKRTQELLSNEMKLRQAAETKITELLTAWDNYA